MTLTRRQFLRSTVAVGAVVAAVPAIAVTSADPILTAAQRMADPPVMTATEVLHRQREFFARVEPIFADLVDFQAQQCRALLDQAVLRSPA